MAQIAWLLLCQRRFVTPSNLSLLLKQQAWRQQSLELPAVL